MALTEKTHHGDQFFDHDDGVRRAGTDQLTSTTRYLAGAAYMDGTFADRVIDELVADSHRAVVPAIGFDISAVIHHCFQARRLWMAQNAMITTVLVIGLCAVPAPTLTLLALLALLAVPMLARSRPNWPAWKVVTLVIVGLILLSCAGPVFALAQQFGGFSSLTEPDALGQPYGGEESLAPLWEFMAAALAVALALLAVLAWSRHRMIRIITTELAPGAAHRPRPASRTAVQHRIGVVETAQHGNIVLHSGYDPFVGAGREVRAWSVAMELRAGDGSRPSGNGTPPAQQMRARRVQIDPVELVGHVRQRLAGLRSRELPDQERMTGLQLRDQVVASGTRWHDYPLIDQRVRLPYAFATADAIDAIIRFPQTSARHFLRASVGAQDKQAVSADGRTIMPSEHQSVVSSTYTHIAVEGGMLYVEIVATVLGPLRQDYLDIDRYLVGAPDLLGTALGEAVRRLASATVAAPVRLGRTLIHNIRYANSMNRSDREAMTEPVYDFGARVDVRQLASRASYASYVQRLDAEKYIRLIERRTTEAVMEFLAAKGIDTSEYENKVNFHQYNSTSIAGSNYGPVATGSGATATDMSKAKPGVKAS